MINFEEQFDSLKKKYNEIEKNLNNQEGLDSEKLVKLNKEYAELKPIVESIGKFQKSQKDIKDLRHQKSSYLYHVQRIIGCIRY